MRELADRADRMERQLTAAAKLIDGLGSERTRWSKDKEELNAKKDRYNYRHINLLFYSQITDLIRDLNIVSSDLLFHISISLFLLF